MASGTEKRATGLISFVLIVGGVSGLLHEWLDWIHVFGFVRFVVPSGDEVFSYVVMVVLGVAVGAAGDRFRPSGSADG